MSYERLSRHELKYDIKVRHHRVLHKSPFNFLIRQRIKSRSNLRCYNLELAGWRGRATRNEGQTMLVERRACVPYRERRAWTFSALARARPDRSLLRPRSSPGVSDGASRQVQHRSGMHLSQRGWPAEGCRCFWALGCTCTWPECAEDFVPR